MVLIYQEDTLQGPELPLSHLFTVCERRFMDVVKETMELVSVRRMQLIGLDGGR